jgi:hypothetical protein
MKILWTLLANTKGIDTKCDYPEYDEKNLSSKYWMYDMENFINGDVIEKKIICLNKYEILFSCKTYDFILNDYIKFHSGCFHTSSLAIIDNNNKQILYNQSNKSKNTNK